MRTLVNIPDADVAKLDALAAKGKRSRAAEIREAVRLYIVGKSDADWIERGFGLWKDRADIGDTVEYQRRLRAESTRPWDADYEEVKAEFPDLFTDEDDRERAHYLALAPAKEEQGREPGRP